jgi:WD40 repeat protein
VLILYFQKRPPDVPLHFWSVSFSADGKMIATAGGQNNPDALPRIGELILWDSQNGKQKRIFHQESSIRSVTWATDGKFIVIGDFGGGTTLVRPDTAKPIASLPPHGGGKEGCVNSVSISRDCKLVAIGSVDGTVTLWDTAGKELEPLILPQGEKAFNVAVSPNHGSVLVGGWRGKAYLYDVSQRGEPRIVEACQDRSLREARVETVAFTSNGERFATGCKLTVRLWETSSGKLLRDVIGCANSVNCLAFSPDGSRLATVDADGTLALWDTGTGDYVKSTSAHDGGSFGVGFSPDGKRLVTVGRRDFMGKVWDAASLTIVSSFRRVETHH